MQKVRRQQQKPETPLTEKQRQELVERGMKIWRDSGTKYRSLPGEYQALIKECCGLGIEPLVRTSASTLRGYPKDKFLDIENDVEARNFLNSLGDDALRSAVDESDFNVHAHHCFNSLAVDVFNFRYRLRHRNDKKCPFGADPNKCGGTGKSRMSWKYDD